VKKLETVSEKPELAVEMGKKNFEVLIILSKIYFF